MNTIDALRQIEAQLANEPLPKAQQAWGGADVVISTRPSPACGAEGFYPEPRRVVTAYAPELSWMFEALRDAFYAEDRLDGQTKIEFFGRLANAANRCLTRSADADARDLCAAVLHEAFAIFDEMEEGSFRSLPLTVGNEIADDYVDEALRTGFIGIEETRKFFSERGVELEDI
jgi:hypothetical protein